MSEITLTDVMQAHGRIRDWVRRTPVLTSSRLDEANDCRLFFKCENFQSTGAFKARGASNAVLCLDEESARRGVATHSSGNHAAALARAAKLRGIPAFIVMPTTASRVKVESVERFGGRIIFCEPNQRSREETAARVAAETGATLIHPYNDPRVIAGQATAALELMEEVPDLDAVFCPLGGGGLLSGCAIVATSLSPKIRVFGAEPLGANDCLRSLAAGVRTAVENPSSMADGLLAFVGDLTFPIIQKHVSGIVAVSEQEIIDAMRLLMEILKIVVEPSGAVGFAALRRAALEHRGKRIGIVISGGNVDLVSIPWKTPAN